MPAEESKGFDLIDLMIVVVIIGILAAITIPNFINMQTRGREAQVKANCHDLQLAAEDFSVQNGGVYAKSLSDKLPSGDTVIDLLPDGRMFENPFTKSFDSPVDLNGQWPLPLTQGETGYESLDNNGDGVVDGYKITGCGRDGVTITLTSGL